MVQTKYWILSVASLCVAASSVFAQGNDKQFSESMTKYLASEEGQKAVGKTVEDYFQKRQQEMVKDRDSQQKAELEEQFKNPVKVDVGAAPIKGPANAKVTIVEFSDFQCPYCKRGKETVDQIVKAYPNDVKIAFKNLPLEFHKDALPAAKAAYAAGKQGKFWEFHDALFGNQGKLGDDFYLETAKSLGLDVDKFNKDRAAPETEAAIKADAEQGGKVGIQGTPGFFVNGVAVKGAYPFEHFKSIIDRQLGKPAA